MYEILLERSAEKDLKRLQAEDFHKIIRHIKALGEKPLPSGCRKITGSSTDWRIRVGNFRMIFEVNDRAKTVRVMRIRHRREVHR